MSRTRRRKQFNSKREARLTREIQFERPPPERQQEIIKILMDEFGWGGKKIQRIRQKRNHRGKPGKEWPGYT